MIWNIWTIFDLKFTQFFLWNIEFSTVQGLKRLTWFPTLNDDGLRSFSFIPVAEIFQPTLINFSYFPTMKHENPFCGKKYPFEFFQTNTSTKRMVRVFHKLSHAFIWCRHFKTTREYLEDLLLATYDNFCYDESHSNG